ncbi:MAG TPA: Na+/H+ antiporter subunit E [Streptosporangiaceae bacterium]
MLSRVIALFTWAFAVWVLLTWTLTVEMMLFGVGFAAAVAVALAPLGRVAGPWLLLRPRRLAAAISLLAAAVGRIVQANLKLSRLIWHPRLTKRDGPLRSGMVIVPTHYESAGHLTAVGLITSLIVDNQITDIDRSRRELQYHAVEVPDGGGDMAREEINGPVERWLAPFSGRQAQ